MYLGASIDRALTFEDQAKSVRDATHFFNFKMGKIRPSVPIYAAIAIFKQPILPKFDYCSFLLDGCNQKWKDKIGRIQHRSLWCRLQVQIRGNSIESIYEKCTTPLPPLRRKEMLISQFHSRARKVDSNPNPRTRSSFLPTFTLRRPRTEFYKKSPYYRGARWWNKLPTYLQTCTEKN